MIKASTVDCLPLYWRIMCKFALESLFTSLYAYMFRESCVCVWCCRLPFREIYIDIIAFITPGAIRSALVSLNSGIFRAAVFLR